MRGKDCLHLLSSFVRRITPACAGKRTTPKYPVMDDRDHPRMCGEKNIVRKASFDPQGSPPHVRGKGTVLSEMITSQRITPACAGKRVFGCCHADDGQDHPRMCGEKKVMRSGKDKHMGSPPHVRGKGFLYFAHEMFEGITPACAGKSSTRFLTEILSWDHPRMCGEKLLWYLRQRSKMGSPPHVRGKA